MDMKLGLSPYKRNIDLGCWEQGAKENTWPEREEVMGGWGSQLVLFTKY
jgi:hypothetical protein